MDGGGIVWCVCEGVCEGAVLGEGLTVVAGVGVCA